MQLIFLRHDSEDPVVIEVPDDSDADLVYQLLAAETGKSFRQEYIEFDGRPVKPGESLLQLGVLDGATLFIKPLQSSGFPRNAAAAGTTATSAAAAPSSTTLTSQSSRASSAPYVSSVGEIPANVTPEGLISICHNNPHILTQILASDPDLGGAIQLQDIPKLRTIIMKRLMERHKHEHERKQELIRMSEDPMNPEIQKKIEEQIRRENIEANMAAAMENLPESFGRVTMLYVNIEVNGTPVKAFVDSGAQSTIMSERCAEKCNITHLIDTRFAGQARGVGTAKILGRVHIAQMRFGNSVFPISITILENNDVDFLFGLDTLRRYRCCIDLSRNLLRVDGVNGVEEIPFLSESELPEGARGIDAEELAKMKSDKK